MKNRCHNCRWRLKLEEMLKDVDARSIRSELKYFLRVRRSTSGPSTQGDTQRFDGLRICRGCCSQLEACVR